MRRYVLILMMLVLPLQWSWSVAASICAHEAAGAQAHVGHHEHVHAPSEPNVDSPDADTAPAYHADCGTCHGQGSLAMAAAAAMPLPDVDAPTPGALVRHLPDRAPDNLLRPPLSHLV